MIGSCRHLLGYLSLLLARQLHAQQPSVLILCHALAHRNHSASSRSCWVRGIALKLVKSTYAQAHHRTISTQMLPPLCGRNPLSSQNQMSSWDFFLSPCSLLGKERLEAPFKLTTNCTLSSFLFPSLELTVIFCQSCRAFKYSAFMANHFYPKFCL